MRRFGVQLVAITLTGLAAIVAAVMLLSGVAKADSVDDYIATYADAICTFLDEHHTPEGVDTAIQTVYANGFSQRDTAGIMVQAINETCPRNWPLLQNFIDLYKDGSVMKR